MLRIVLTVLTFFILGLPAQAQSHRWVAASDTAMSITGDIRVSADSITFANGQSLTLQRVSEDVYKAMPPSDPKLLHGNTLCGSPVTYITLASSSEELEMKVYTGDIQPSASDGDQMCASYSYTTP